MVNLRVPQESLMVKINSNVVKLTSHYTLQSYKIDSNLIKEKISNSKEFDLYRHHRAQQK